MEQKKNIIELSHLYGNDTDFVIGWGGNTSVKDEQTIWVKASGTELASLTEADLIEMDRRALREIVNSKTYSTDLDEQEVQVKRDILRAKWNPETSSRPSVETLIHEIIDYTYVVHTHPTIVNGVLCSNQAEQTINSVFKDEALYISYTKPGYTLATKIQQALSDYREKHGSDAAPQMIFLQNHGLMVAADDPGEIQQITNRILETLSSRLSKQIDTTEAEGSADLTYILPVIRTRLSGETQQTTVIRNNALISSFLTKEFIKDEKPAELTPDHLVFCNPSAIFIPETDKEVMVKTIQEEIDQYIRVNGFPPKIIGIENNGIIGVGNHYHAAQDALNAFEDALKIHYYAEDFGGIRKMSKEEISFIINWDAEKYKKSVAHTSSNSFIAGRTIVVTGGAQGFGGGIAETLYKNGANVVLADVNEETGKAKEAELNQNQGKNMALFVHVDVSKADSVERLIRETVYHFGGLDVFISNAGVLKAGSLDEMDPETFDFITRVNYKGFFLCSKYASKVMKVEAEHDPDKFMDIIQINSKSGLVGSNKNFTYAGGKFGGIGLTESFAKELMPHHIKVNAICPGNFFEGPLWSDPDNGLFVQYLRAGKVPGAETIEDVKQHYEKQVPAGRGCRPEDVMQAIYYVIRQKYETGQAVPVTGGQVMLK